MQDLGFQTAISFTKALFQPKYYSSRKVKKQLSKLTAKFSEQEGSPVKHHGIHYASK